MKYRMQAPCNTAHYAVICGGSDLLRLAILIAFLLAVSFETRGNMICGSLPNGDSPYTISTEAGNTFGTAVEFTPLVNVSFSSITLWISGYTGQDGSSLSLCLMSDGSSYGLPAGPLITIASGTSAANGGADADLSFDLAGHLCADTPYWLFLYLAVPGGGFGPDMGKFNCNWDSGGTPFGNVDIDGSEAFANFFSPSSFQPTTPAFAIVSVPEPASTFWLLIFAAASCLLWRLYRSPN